MLMQFFCCCIELRSAAIGLGYAGMGFSVPMLCMIFYGLANRAELLPQHVDVYALFCMLYILVLFGKFFSDLLLILRSKGNVELLIWLFVNAATILLTFLALTLCLFLRNWDWILYIELFIGLVSVCHVYVWWCVLSLYRANEQDDENKIIHQYLVDATLHL